MEFIPSMKFWYAEDGLPFYYSILELIMWACINYPLIYGLFLLFFTCLEYTITLYKKDLEFEDSRE